MELAKETGKKCPVREKMVPQEASEEKLRRECLSVSNAANKLGKLKTYNGL